MNHFPLKFHLKLVKGILDLKSIEWVSDFKNLGLVDNIPYFFQEYYKMINYINTIVILKMN